MKRTSKYLHKQFGDWTCTHVGISRVQPKKTLSGRKSRQPGHKPTTYSGTRITSTVRKISSFKSSTGSKSLSR